MAKNKRKWTLPDTVIIIAVVAAVGACYKMFGGKFGGGEKKTITAQILLSAKEQGLYDAIKAAEGEPVTLSLTEKDSGTVKSVECTPAEVMTFNSNKGEYNLEINNGKVDIYATVEIQAEENDYSFSVGSTVVKVGDSIPFRGKGYAAEGYVISINEEAE